MAETPSLDDRRYQDLVDDALRVYDRSASSHVLPDSTPRAVIEAAAFVADQLIYRLNQVPRHLHTALLDIVGVRPFAARAARTDVTFWLAAPVADDERTVPAHTQVSEPSYEDRDPQVFTTTEKLRLHAVGQPRLWWQRAGQEPEPAYERLTFSDPPQVGDAFLFGFDRPGPAHAVQLDVECSLEGVGVDPRRPPLVWEAWVGDHWVGCEVDRDETGGLSIPGQLVVHLPRGHAMAKVGGERAAWLRCRIVEAEPGQVTYTHSPAVTGVRASIVGGTVGAIHARIVPEELLGTSNGLPGQRFRLRDAPIVEPGDDVVVEILEDGNWVPWRIVPDFAGRFSLEQNVQIDPGTGEVRFAPVIREPGTIRHHGAVPADGALIRIRNHMVGGGTAGNVARGALTVLQTTVPYVAYVENRHPAWGGIDAETEDEAKKRIPLALRTRDRAVTTEDYEHLARWAAPEVVRVRCLPGDAPASVRVLVVPAAPEDEQGRLDFADLVPSDDTLERIAIHLDERRVVGTRVLIEPPFYCGLAVVAELSCRHVDPRSITARATEALYRFYHPVTGGPDGDGWPFGRAVTVWETYSVLQRVTGVDRVNDVRLFARGPAGGGEGRQVQQLDIPPDGLAFSVEHHVRVVGA